MNLPFGRRSPEEREEAMRIRRKDRIRFRRSGRINDPVKLSDLNEFEVETLARYSKRCDSLSSLDYKDDSLIRKRKNKEDDESDLIDEEYVDKFKEKNLNDEFPVKITVKKVDPPSFYHSYDTDNLYPMPKYNPPVIPAIPEIDTTLPDSFTKRRMKKYLKERGEKITSYMK